jgi:hypothetical protein
MVARTTMYQSQALMCLRMDCTSCSAKKKGTPITVNYACHSTTVRFDFEDDTPFFLVRFTFIGSGVFVRGISSSTT